MSQQTPIKEIRVIASSPCESSLCPADSLTSAESDVVMVERRNIAGQEPQLPQVILVPLVSIDSQLLPTSPSL